MAVRGGQRGEVEHAILGARAPLAFAQAKRRDQPQAQRGDDAKDAERNTQSTQSTDSFGIEDDPEFDDVSGSGDDAGSDQMGKLLLVLWRPRQIRHKAQTPGPV